MLKSVKELQPLDLEHKRCMCGEHLSELLDTETILNHDPTNLSGGTIQKSKPTGLFTCPTCRLTYFIPELLNFRRSYMERIRT